MSSSATTSIHSTTQEFIDIFDITNDLVIMKDGSTALILTVDAMNFGLLAEEEQDAVMYAYAGLLNSLNYSIQIVIRSQTKDATNYLNLLRDQEQTASSETKRSFIREYREFVANLIRERNVLDKKFYIAIPATSLEMGLMPPSTVIPGVKKTDISTVERSVILDKAKTILEPKRDHLVSQFGRLGLYARQLQTQEIIQLFYTSYNPEAAEGQQITDTSNYVTPLVEASTTASYQAAPQASTDTVPAPALPELFAPTVQPVPSPPAPVVAPPVAPPLPAVVPPAIQETPIYSATESLPPPIASVTPPVTPTVAPISPLMPAAAPMTTESSLPLPSLPPIPEIQ